MNEQNLHDLAVAFAQVKLFRHQQEHPEDSGYSEEFRLFLKWYKSALIHLPEEDKDIDISLLM